MNTENIRLLAQKFVDGTATEEEKIALHTWYDGWQDDEEVVVTTNEETLEQVRDKIFAAIKKDISLTDTNAPKVFSIKRQWYMVAAAAVLFVMAGLYFLNTEKKTTNAGKIAVATIKDIAAPKGSKAMIQLANGGSVLLDSINSGTLASQGNIKVVKQANGEIVYTGEGTEVAYNTLVNPRGSNVVNITLQDGSKVWLNSESSIKYPTAFSGNERKVELTGEAYFEVAHDPTKKFIVNSNNVQTEVFGTHFNVNAYPDEKEMKITLLEGSVKVSKGEKNTMLIPGQQAKVSDDIKLLHNVDTDKAIAWKNGRFIFDSENIQTIMGQIGRWYGPVVEYKGAVSKETFSGIVSRDSNLSEVLKIMQQGGVKFSMENKKIIVTQ